MVSVPPHVWFAHMAQVGWKLLFVDPLVGVISVIVGAPLIFR